MSFRPLLLAGLALSGAAAVAGCTPPPPLAPVAPGTVFYSQQCQAGFYQCVLPAAGQVGSPCACPGLGAPSYGVIR